MNRVLRSAVVGMVLCTVPVLVIAQDEAGFAPVGPWVAEPGSRTSNQGDALLVRNGSIRTKRIYSDFVLRFEFRLLEPSSEGRLLVRSWFGYGNSPRNERGYRIALTNNTDGKEALGRVTAAELKLKEATFDPTPALGLAGEWQECELRAERDSITVQINRAVVSTVQGLDGFAGYLALQSNSGSGIEFRNMRARRLPSAHEPFGQNAYRGSDADVGLPRAIQRAQPFYPREPHAAGVEGTVDLELVVESTGSVGDVRVIKSLDPDLDEAAIASARQWRFTPGTKSGRPVAVIVTMDVAFRVRK